MMRALLMADPAAAAVLDKLPASGKLVDISSISAVRARTAKTLALATRRLLTDTARDGQAAWVSRLQQVTREHLGRELTENDQAMISAMAAGLPPDLFRHIDGQWLSTHTPLAQRDAPPGRLVNSAASPQVTTKPPASTMTCSCRRRWTRHSSHFVLRERRPAEGG